MSISEPPAKARSWIPRKRKTLAMLLLASTLIIAVSFGVLTSQTSYGCGSPSYRKDTVLQPNATRNEVYNQGSSWNVFLELCFYVYFIGIVGGSILIIFSIPSPVSDRLR